jgi:hypothetical protein
MAIQATACALMVANEDGARTAASLVLASIA